MNVSRKYFQGDVVSVVQSPGAASVAYKEVSQFWTTPEEKCHFTVVSFHCPWKLITPCIAEARIFPLLTAALTPAWRIPLRALCAPAKQV